MSEKFPLRFPSRAEHAGSQHIRPDPVDLFAVVRFEGSAALIALLTARGIPVRVFDSLPAAITVLRTVSTAVLVIRVPLEARDERGALTFVIRNLETLGPRRDLFHDRFAQFFSGPVDPKTLCAAVIRHATASDPADQYRPEQVA